MRADDVPVAKPLRSADPTITADSTQRKSARFRDKNNMKRDIGASIEDALAPVSQ